MNDPATKPETWTVWTHTDEEYKHELGAYSAGASMDDRITSDAIRELLDARAELSLALELLREADAIIEYRDLAHWKSLLLRSGLLGEIGGDGR